MLPVQWKVRTYQSGLRNTDGLLAHRRATSSPQTGYYEIARLLATSSETLLVVSTIHGWGQFAVLSIVFSNVPL